MVEDVKGIVSRYNQLRLENPLLDGRKALKKAFYERSKDFGDPIEIYHILVSDFISCLDTDPQLVEDFLTEDIIRNPKTLAKLAKARLEKHQRKTRQLAGASKRTPTAQFLKTKGITPETSVVAEQVMAIPDPARPESTVPFQVPTVTSLTERQMTPVESSMVMGVGSYKGHLLVQYHHDPDNIWGYPVGGQKAVEYFNEMLISGSKGGWVWDKLLGKPSQYGMDKGTFHAIPQPNGETKFFTSKGAKFVHLEPYPVKFTYNPIGWQGGKELYEQQAKTWKEMKEETVSPSTSREPKEIALLQQQQERGETLMKELAQLFKAKGLDFTEDIISECVKRGFEKYKDKPKFQEKTEYQKLRFLYGVCRGDFIEGAEGGKWITLNADKDNSDTKGTKIFIGKGQNLKEAISQRFGKKGTEKRSKTIEKAKNIKEEIIKLKKRYKEQPEKRRQLLDRIHELQKEVNQFLFIPAKGSKPIGKPRKKGLKALKALKRDMINVMDFIESYDKDFTEDVERIYQGLKAPRSKKAGSWKLEISFDEIRKARVIISNESENLEYQFDGERGKVEGIYKSLRSNKAINEYIESDPLELIRTSQTKQEKGKEKKSILKQNIKFLEREGTSEEVKEAKEKLSKYREKGKGKGWWGESDRHSKAAKKGKQFIKEIEGGNLTKKDFELNDKIVLRNVKAILHVRTDFVDFSKFKLDFTEDYTHMYGPITHGKKGGHFDYRDPSDPTKIVRVYKDYNSIKEAHKGVDYYPIIGTQLKGSHKADVIGFTYGYEPHDDTEEMYAHGILFNDLVDISDIDLLEKRQVSIGFDDEIIGDTQYVKAIDHLAMSLDNVEMGKCLEGGNDCYMEVKEDMCPYGINPVLTGLKEVLTITNER